MDRRCVICNSNSIMDETSNYCDECKAIMMLPVEEVVKRYSVTRKELKVILRSIKDDPDMEFVNTAIRNTLK